MSAFSPHVVAGKRVDAGRASGDGGRLQVAPLRHLHDPCHHDPRG